MAKKISYIVSNINKALAFEWIIQYIDKERYDLYFILINSENSELEFFLRARGVKVFHISYSGKKDLLKACLSCYKILKNEKTEIIHCHLFEACIIGLVAAKFLGIKKRIYTRHHSTLHHVYFPTAVYYDKFINSLATHIVAISNVIKNVLLKDENVNKKKIRLIPHGFVLKDFQNANNSKVTFLKSKYNEKGKQPVIGVISRYMDWKGIQYIIPAFKKVLEIHPSAYLILANAHGPYEAEIKSYLKKLPNDSFYEVKFESDIFSLYHLFDIFVHVPIDEHSEAFGQIYVEALAAGIPSVFTLSGIASEFIVNKENALVVNYKNSEEIYNAILLLINDKKLCESLKVKGIESVKEKFDLKNMITSLESVYAE